MRLHLQPCECEHASHFDIPGRRNGCRHAAVLLVTTTWGTFWLCDDCLRAYHMRPEAAPRTDLRTPLLADALRRFSHAR